VRHGVVLGFMMAGCTQQPTTAATPTTSTAASLVATGTVPVVANDLSTNSAHHTLPVDGEQLS